MRKSLALFWVCGVLSFSTNACIAETLIGYLDYNGTNEQIVWIDAVTWSNSVIATLDLAYTSTHGFSVDSANDKAYLAGQRTEESFWRLFTVDLITGATTNIVMTNTVNHFDSYSPVPSAPSVVSATDGQYTDKVQVTWNDVSAATGYQVWRNTNDNADCGLRK